MELGKLSVRQLEEIIFKNITTKSEKVLKGANLGQDCAVIDAGENLIVLTSDPITGTSNQIGKLAMNINFNDLASEGTMPFGVMLTILLPESTKEEELNQIMVEINEEAVKYNVQILGGHTEVTNAVTRPIISITAIGIKSKGIDNHRRNIQEGDIILMSKHVAIEGVSIIFNEKLDEIQDLLTTDEKLEIKNYTNDLSVVKEGIIASDCKVVAMHDVTEGGVLGAVYEMAKGCKLGANICFENIPIKESTIKICDFFGINPLRLISSGSMIIVCPRENLKLLEEKFLQENINISILGTFTKEKEVFITKKGIKYLVDPPKGDELYKVI